MLVDRKKVRGTGIEIVEEKVYDAVAKGVTVYHGDFDEGLSYYPDNRFDYVDPQPDPPGGPGDALRHAGGPSGRAALVASFPNFGHWKARGQLLPAGQGAGDPGRCRTSGTTRPTCTL